MFHIVASSSDEAIGRAQAMAGANFDGELKEAPPTPYGLCGQPCWPEALRVIPGEFRHAVAQDWETHHGRVDEAAVAGDELLFELRGLDGHVWRLYLDGRAEGFPIGTVIVNRAKPLFESLAIASGAANTHSSSEASLSRQSCPLSMSPQCDRAAPAKQPRTLGEKIALIHLVSEQCRLLGLRPPTWSGWDEILK